MSCKNCSKYSALVEARTQKNQNGEYTIYGYCFKTGFQQHNHSGYPVYIPDGECEDFKTKRLKKDDTPIEGQISLFDYV